MQRCALTGTSGLPGQAGPLFRPDALGALIASFALLSQCPTESFSAAWGAAREESKTEGCAGQAQASERHGTQA